MQIAICFTWIAWGTNRRKAKGELEDNDLSELCQSTLPVINSALKSVPRSTSVGPRIHLVLSQFITHRAEYKQEGLIVKTRYTLFG